jgi:hypothetical protein
MRLAVLSNTELHPAVNWTTLGPPLLEPLAAYPGAHLIAPPPFRWDRRSDWLAAVRRYLRSDTVFWMQSSSRPELPLWALSAIKPTMRRSAFVVDAWRPALTKIGSHFASSYGRWALLERVSETPRVLALAEAHRRAEGPKPTSPVDAKPRSQPDAVRTILAA